MPNRLAVLLLCAFTLGCMDYDLADDDAAADDDVGVGDDDTLPDDDVTPPDDDDDADVLWDDDDTAVADDDDTVGDDDDVAPVLPTPCDNAPSALWVPATYTSIQAAINAATVGDMICVDPGTYYECIDFLGKDISVVGLGGAAATIIDGAGSAPAVTFTSGESPAALLQGFTVTHGWSSYDAGGFLLDQASPTLTQLIVEGNYADYEGGGFEMDESSPSLDRVIIRDNISGYQGGGMNLRYSSPRLSNVAFVGNVTDHGGGAIKISAASTLELTNAILTGNVDVGGAIVSMRHCDVFGNSPPEFDGMTSPVGANGNIADAPGLLDTSNPDPWLWDVHIDSTSTLVDAGDPTLTDPDGSVSDIGAYGGLGAEQWDLDWDAFTEWWLPGAYDPATSPNSDCDDRDEAVFPGSGC